jgi:hypothetical protein
MVLRVKPIFLKVLLTCCCILQLWGCVLSPVERSNKKASEYGFKRQLFNGTEFRHVTYTANLENKGMPLHVYLEGDGVPWLTEKTIAADPNSRAPVMLALMAMDKAPSIYLGRPCYLGLSNDPGCEASLWTFSRYSQQIVASMTEVIKQVMTQYGFSSVKLFGHSGGGTLAVLMAESLPETAAVVTLAGNLDVEAWTNYHHYTSLYGSLNPANDTMLNPAIYQLHLQGAKDEVVPPQLAASWFSQQKNPDIRVYPEFDHRCCWKDIWIKILTHSLADGN